MLVSLVRVRNLCGMITEQDREKLREVMFALIKELEESLPALREKASPVAPDNSIGRLSRYDSMVNAGTAEMALQEAQKRLQRLRNNLARVDGPDFGKCAMCGDDISKERLFAAPDRGICVSCMKKR